jgi:hypothetical protein
MRGFVNLLIVILIAYTLNAIPINTSLLSFDLLKPWDKISQSENVQDEIETTPFPTITLSKASEDQYYNPSTLGVTFSSDKELNKEQFDQLKKIIKIYKTSATGVQEDLLEEYAASNISLADALLDASEEGNWTYQLDLDVSRDSAGFFMGAYDLKLEISDELLGLNSQTTYHLVYAPDLEYIPAIAQVNPDQIYTQVYYLNETKEFLIPVTKKLSSSSKFIRNTISSLSYEPPSNERIFAQDIVFPKLPRVYLNKGTLSCYLNGSELRKFDETKAENKLISEAIVKTLTDIGYVDNLVFYVNDRQNGNFINGLPLKTIYNEDYNVYAYVNYYDNVGKGYLVPQLVSDGQDTVEDILNILMTTHKPIGSYGVLTATVPTTVDLISSKIEESRLSITFNDELLTVYQDNEMLEQLMMDSIVQSLTSLSSVNEIVITTETKKTGMIGNVSLGQALSANRFLNPIN